MIDLVSSIPAQPRTLSLMAKVLWVGSWFVACQAMAQTPAASEALPDSAPLGSSAEVHVAAPATPIAKAPVKPWKNLTLKQKQALAPLEGKWDSLTEQQQKKWLTISDTFLQLTDDEQLTMHGRMSEWASLSAKQRSEARFNFNSTLSLPIEDKRAQWQAYQSLPERDKQQLSSGPKPPAKSAARTTLPASNRLVSPPTRPVNTPKAIPRVAPSQPVDPKTLLPKSARPTKAGACLEPGPSTHSVQWASNGFSLSSDKLLV